MPFCTITNSPNFNESLSKLIATPALPTAIITLPQLGSSPAIAVLTNEELAIENAIFFASFSVLQFLIVMLINFDESLNKVLLNLAKRVVADGEGASKFITINISNSKTDEEAKKIAFSIANSSLVKTAIAGEDPNWGRIIMALGKSDATINLSQLSIKFGELNVVQKGKIYSQYSEEEASKYMKNSNIEIFINVASGSKSFTAYTMDLTRKYIEINADYRS